MDRKLWTEACAIAARHAHGDRAAGEDLAQDLALAALEGARATRNPAAWLERVGRNAVIHWWRAEARRAELAPAIEPPSTPLDPEAARRVVSGAAWCGARWRRCRGPSGGRRWPGVPYGDLPYAAVAALSSEPRPSRSRRGPRGRWPACARGLGVLRAMFFLPGVQMSALGRGVRGGRIAAPFGPRRRFPFARRGSRLSPPGSAHHFARDAPDGRGVAYSGCHGRIWLCAPNRAAAPVEPAEDDAPAAQRMVFGDDSSMGRSGGPEARLSASCRRPGTVADRDRSTFVPEW